MVEGGVAAGDVSVCLYCSTVSLFTDDLLLREPTAAEAAELVKEPGVREAIALGVRYRLQRGFAGWSP
jgi:hypothetical protein